MITLITGIPGTGKTALAVKTLLELRGERPVFSNINGLKLDHTPIDADWIKNWHEQAPHDALIVIDEAQKYFRPRHNSAAVPPNVAAFEEHRHQGVDFILITQRSGLVDHNIKLLAGRHLHVRVTSLTRTIHEAAEVVDFNEKSVRAENASRPYKLPREVFGLYKSSDHHTKPARPRIPNAVYLFAVAVLAVGFFGWQAYASISEKITPETDQAAPPPVEGAPPSGAPDQGRPPRIVSGLPESLPEALTPQDPHNPLSAPIYAQVQHVVTAPVVIGCIQSRAACTCYTQQATPVWLPEDQCRQRAQGQYYDPYTPPPTDKTPGLNTAQGQPSPRGLARGFDGGTEPNVTRSPEGAAPPSGAGLFGES